MTTHARQTRTGHDDAPPDDVAGERIWRRWQALTLTDPVARLVRAGAHAQLDESEWDLRQLAVRAIDVVVGAQAGVSGEVAPERLVDALTQYAREMVPADPQSRWRDVAELVLGALLNAQRQHLPFKMRYVPVGDDTCPARAREYSFRLLSLVDGRDGPIVTASTEAVMLYVSALDVDLADRRAAANIVLQRHLRAGHYDKALRAAVEAAELANAHATIIAEQVDLTRRDLSRVDWSEDLPGRLTEALELVVNQISDEEQMLELVRSAADGDDADVHAVCRRIEQAVMHAQAVNVRLERQIQSAIPTFLAAQEAQRLRRRSATVLWNLLGDLLLPTLELAAGPALDVVRAFSSAPLGVRCPKVLSGDAAMQLLLAAPPEYDRSTGVFDAPEDLCDMELDNVTPAVAAAAAELFTPALDSPLRMSQLLRSARESPADPADPSLADVVWAACLWLFVAGGVAAERDELPPNALGELLTRLDAASDSGLLDDEDFAGHDLLIGTTSAIADVTSHTDLHGRFGAEEGMAHDQLLSA